MKDCLYVRSLDSEDVKKTLNGLLSSKQRACEKSYSPQFVRLVPPVMPVDDEVIIHIEFRHR